MMPATTLHFCCPPYGRRGPGGFSLHLEANFDLQEACRILFLPPLCPPEAPLDFAFR